MRSYGLEYSLERMCRQLGVDKSGYYRWKKPEEQEREQSNEELLCAIKEEYSTSRCLYGSRG